MIQEALHFDGFTYSPKHDGERLGKQLLAVRALLSTGRWFTLAELAEQAGGSEAGCSARIRDLRKNRFGGHVIERRRRTQGTWEYRLVS